jgi:hypothetical protein
VYDWNLVPNCTVNTGTDCTDALCNISIRTVVLPPSSDFYVCHRM